jgi:hypothetical protein
LAEQQPPTEIPRDDESQHRRYWKFVAEELIATLERLAILFALYVLSIGPMYWTWVGAKYLHGSYLVAVFYEPLWQLAGLIPPLGEWINWYVKWWNL